LPTLGQAPKIHVKYELHKRKLGEGSFGAVFTCTQRSTQTILACKSIKLGAISSHDLKALHMEISIMTMMDHPHIIKLEEVFYGSSVVYLVMGLCKVRVMFNYSTTLVQISQLLM
jgi:serine/threonine protein kinase